MRGLSSLFCLLNAPKDSYPSTTMSPSADQQMLRVEAQHVGFFETPVAYCRLKNAEAHMGSLEKSIRKKMNESEGLSRSNFSGWHSDTNMLDWGGPSARELAKTAVRICKRMTIFQDADAEGFQWKVKMWANVSPKGGLNQLHSHPGNLWAAVLYLDMGENPDDPEEDVGGGFYIEDPRFPMAAMHNPAVRLLGANGEPQQFEIQFQLQKGNLVVFPAWLKHGVRPYFGDRQRISIAMNIDAQQKVSNPD